MASVLSFSFTLSMDTNWGTYVLKIKHHNLIFFVLHKLPSVYIFILTPTVIPHLNPHPQMSKC